MPLEKVYLISNNKYMDSSIDGVVIAHICEVRFAFSGKLVWVGKKIGDPVKQWEAIASLDKKLLQAELDLELADYEKVRADFEIFNIKNGKEGGDDTTKYLRQEKQSSLNASVKQVEIAKYHLDQGNLYSPVNGVITNMEGVYAGVNITPASSAVQILASDSIAFAFEVDQKDLQPYLSPAEVRITFVGIDKTVDGTTLPPFLGKNGNFEIRTTLKDTSGLLMGMKGKVG